MRHCGDEADDVEKNDAEYMNMTTMRKNIGIIVKRFRLQIGIIIISI